MDPIDLALVDETVQRVLAAWAHARIRRAGDDDTCSCCGWTYDRDRLARFADVTTRELERALELMESARLVVADTGAVDDTAQAYVRSAIAERIRRDAGGRGRKGRPGA